MTLGDLVKEYRDAHGLSLRAFSQKAEISHSEVLRIEKGMRATPSLHTLIRLADAMGTPLDEILSLIQKESNNIRSENVIMTRESVQPCWRYGDPPVGGGILFS